MVTKIGAIKKVLEDNCGIANWQIIYNEIENIILMAKNQSSGRKVSEVFCTEILSKVGLRR